MLLVGSGKGGREERKEGEERNQSTTSDRFLRSRRHLIDGSIASDGVSFYHGWCSWMQTLSVFASLLSINTHLLSYSLFHSTTHSPTHAPTHPLTHPPTHPLTHPPTHPLIYDLTHSLTDPPTHPLTHSPTYSLNSRTHPLTHSPTHSLNHSPYTYSHCLSAAPPATILDGLRH